VRLLVRVGGTLSSEAKRGVYKGLILVTLLFGVEHWSLTAGVIRELRVFHHRRVRTMCGDNRWHTRECRIKTDTLRQRLGIQTFETSTARRQL
jgi:hypothetical protein